MRVFRNPLRHDPLVVVWAVLVLVAAFAALSNNTTWSGHVEAERVAGFLTDLTVALLCSLILLFLAAWLRTRPWDRPGRRAASFDPFPWTDRWLRDWREAESQGRLDVSGPESLLRSLPVTCRHGVPVESPVASERAPVLRALSVSHAIVRPDGRVSVTWCFKDCRSVMVDGRGGHPACGEAVVQVDDTRRIDVVASNRHGSTPVATAAVVAMPVPQLDLPTAAAPPVLSMRADVAATVGGPMPITQRLDEFWEAQEALLPILGAPAPLVGVPPRLAGVPTSVLQGLRRARPTTEEG
jgi:hypothetical protein